MFLFFSFILTDSPQFSFSTCIDPRRTRGWERRKGPDVYWTSTVYDSFLPQQLWREMPRLNGVLILILTWSAVRLRMSQNEEIRNSSWRSHQKRHKTSIRNFALKKKMQLVRSISIAIWYMVQILHQGSNFIRSVYFQVGQILYYINEDPGKFVKRLHELLISSYLTAWTFFIFIFHCFTWFACGLFLSSDFLILHKVRPNNLHFIYNFTIKTSKMMLFNVPIYSLT